MVPLPGSGPAPRSSGVCGCEAVQLLERGQIKLGAAVDRGLVRTLIRPMSLENSLWGAPCIQGELLKLGFDICETTVAKDMVRRQNSPSQTWKAFM